MVNIQSVKQLVMAEVGKNRNLELHDKIIVAVIAYMNFNARSKINTQVTTNMSTGIASAVTNALAELLQKKNNYASYSVLKNFIIGLHKNNILVLTEHEMEQIYNRFLLADKKIEFSAKVFDTEMYNISAIPYHLQQRLANIHFNIMVPIIQYYHDRFGTPIENMTVYSVDEVVNNPGKVIYFAIGGISPATIVNDMRCRLFGVEEKIYKYSLANELVKIIIK